MRLMKFFIVLVASVFSMLLSNAATAAGDPLCTYARYGFRCGNCDEIQRAFFRDKDGSCVACSQICGGIARPAPASGDSKSATTPTNDSTISFVVDDRSRETDFNPKKYSTRPRVFSDQTLREIAAVNPQAARILHSIDTTPLAKVDLANGTAFSSSIATRESFGLMLQKGSTEAVSAIEQKIGEDEGVRVEWRILESADGLASGVVTSHLLDKSERILKTVYPAVRLEFATGKNFRLLSWSVAE
jgi:hypothetical protein